MIKIYCLKMIVAAWVCSAFVFTSCQGDEEDTHLLADGTYPMAFTAAVEGLTAPGTMAGNGGWTGGEEVAVKVGNEVKRYRVAGNGELSIANSSDKPFFWQTAKETKLISAWWCGTEYNEELPSSWAVQADQSKTEPGNTRDNYQRSDFLYAPEVGIKFEERETTPLKFYHQTARVVINIVNSEAVTAAEAIQSVVIGDNNLALSGSFTPPSGNDAKVGTWNGSYDLGSIIPKKETIATGYLSTYSALVIPQNMEGKKFIAITVNDNGYGTNTFYYTPTGNEANLQSGNEYSYDITVKHGYLEVANDKSGTWQPSDKGETITSKELKSGFSAVDIKIGDYYYSDGTTSDGGYREYTDGTSDILNIRPVLTDANGNTRTVIGIVMKVGKDSEGDWKDVDTYYQKNGTPITSITGYVLALHDGNGGGACSWGVEGQVRVDNNDRKLFCGYTNTQMIKDNVGDGKFEDKYPATYYATSDYAIKYPSPPNSSDWFLPSGGQCYYWYQNKDKLMPSIKKAGGESWDGSYWSSSECTTQPKLTAWSVIIDSGNAQDVIVAQEKEWKLKVRSCLAF